MSRDSGANRGQPILSAALCLAVLNVTAAAGVLQKLEDGWRRMPESPAAAPSKDTLDTPEIRKLFEAFKVSGMAGYHGRVMAGHELSQAIRRRGQKQDGTERWMLRAAAGILDAGPVEAQHDLVTLLGEFAGDSGAELILRDVIDGRRSVSLQAAAVTAFGRVNGARRSAQARAYLGRLAESNDFPVAQAAAQALEAYYGDGDPKRRIESVQRSWFRTPEDCVDDLASDRYWKWGDAKKALAGFGARAPVVLLQRMRKENDEERRARLSEAAVPMIKASGGANTEVARLAVAGYQAERSFSWFRALQASSKHPEAWSAILRAAEDETSNQYLRWHAILEMSERKDASAAPILRRLLSDKAEFVSSAAASALAGFDDGSGLPLARSLLRRSAGDPPESSTGTNQTWRVVSNSIRVIQRHGTQSDVSLLEPFTSRGSRFNQRDAKEAIQAIQLRSIGDAAAQLSYLKEEFERSGSSWHLNQIRIRLKGRAFAEYLSAALEHSRLEPAERRYALEALVRTGWVDPQQCGRTGMSCAVLKESYFDKTIREIEGRLKGSSRRGGAKDAEAALYEKALLEMELEQLRQLKQSD